MTMMTYSELQRTIAKFKTDLFRSIQAMPTDNGGKYIGTHIFTLPMSHISKEGNWLPEHYDLVLQKKWVLQAIEDKPIETSLRYLRRLCDSGKFPQNNVRIHSNLRKEISKLLEQVGYK